MNGPKSLWRQRRFQLLIALAAILVVGGLVFYGSGANNITQSKNEPAELKLDLGGTLRGDAAVKALGGNLEAVARSYGMSAAELGRQLHADQDLAVDRRGRLLYTCSRKPGKKALTLSAGRAAGALAPLADTFALHSRPGAEKVIYLDFDGTVLTGTAWNAYDPDGTGPRTPSATIPAPAWNTDGDVTTFSDGERTAIQQIWQRVSEDYAPFDVDVTTEPPAADSITRSSSTDSIYGTVALISPISSSIGNYGGLAYIGIYNRADTTNYYKPALIFPENLGNNEKYIAEAVSHEVGHNLGLSHDGTTTGVTYYSGQGSFETGWAPIMGVGYYKNLTQWSKGEYLNANQLQDDLAVIQTYGLALRADDAGDTIATAVTLTGPMINAGGLITTAADIDFFSFKAGAGQAAFAVKPFERGANLDIQAEVVDESGAVIASSNPIGSLSATLDLVLPAEGTYYLVVQGVGEGNPLETGYSDYASIGQYTISGSVPAPQVTAAQPPTAVASVTPIDGEAPLAVTFDAAGSSDPDGSIATCAWDFGDGSSSSGVTASHTYAGAGTFTAKLTVTDNDGLTAVATRTITVAAPNQAPSAVAGASPVSGTAPFATTLSAAGSTDPDGTIASYVWDFGDGSQGSGVTAAHTYAIAGSFTARLTVTDNRGATATSTVVIAVRAATPSMKVQAIDMSLITVKTTTRQAKGIVKITDAGGGLVSGATVSIQWSGVVSGTASAGTTTAGTATFTSKTFSTRGTATLKVTNVVKSGVVYTPGSNVLTQASITY
jgi:PKD repeat protein